MRYLNASPIIYSKGEIWYESSFEISRSYEIVTFDRFNHSTYCGLHNYKLNLAVF